MYQLFGVGSNASLDKTLLRLVVPHLEVERLRVACISDVHSQQADFSPVAFEGCDVLLVAGDLSKRGGAEELREFASWLRSAPGLPGTKVVIAGNHDSADTGRWIREGAGDSVVYLENESCVVQGLRIFGSPHTPPFKRSMEVHTAFMLPEAALRRAWSAIPTNTDLVLVHGPPHGIRDESILGNHRGDVALRERLSELPSVKCCVFGHIHKGYGATLLDGILHVNAASATLQGRAWHEPIVLEITKE